MCVRPVWIGFWREMEQQRGAARPEARSEVPEPKAVVLFLPLAQDNWGWLIPLNSGESPEEWGVFPASTGKHRFPERVGLLCPCHLGPG